MKKAMIINLLIFGVMYQVQTFAMEKQIIEYKDDQPYIIDRDVVCDFGYCSFDKCKEMIKNNPNIPLTWYEPSSGDLCTVLHIAVEKDNVPAARVLLEAGALVNAPTDCNEYTPLHMVCSKPMAKLLLFHKANLESKDKKGTVPLCHVLFGRQGSYSGHFHLNQLNSDQKQEIACYLLKKGALANAIVDGDTLLHGAVGCGYSMSYRYPEYIDFLLSHGADLEYKDSTKETPYELAIRMFDRCEPALKCFRKYNVFFIANDFAYGDLFELLTNGARKFKKLVGQGLVSNDYTVNKLEKDLAELLRMARCNSDADEGKITLYKKGYCFNKVSYKCLENWVGKDSVEYLHQRFDNCCQHVLSLVQQGNYESVGIYNYPFVLRYNKKIVFELLLQTMIKDKDRFANWVEQWHADTSVTDEDGNTLLHKAIELENAQAIALLIRNKASLLISNKNGTTPMDLLYASQHLDSLKTFKESFIELFFATYSYQPAYQDIKKIIKDGFDVNLCDKDEKPMLLRAIKSHHEKCLFLLKHGAIVTQNMLNEARGSGLSQGIKEALNECYKNQI